MKNSKKTAQICLAKNCLKDSRVKGYCTKHYRQIWKYGHILSRTKYSPNKYEFIGNICLIHLYDKEGTLSAKAIIDVNKYKKVINRKWCLTKSGYVRSRNNVFLHRVINGNPPDGQETDHINRNKLDNRKINLRFCSHLENKLNQEIRQNNTSGFKGVSWHKRTRKWRSEIRFNGKRHYLGLFTSKIEAAKAYNHAALKNTNIEFLNLNIL